jgi:serine protease Do
MAIDLSHAPRGAEDEPGSGSSGPDGVSSALERVAAQVARSVVGVRSSPASSGSGVVWNDRGLVITNYHVVPGTRAEVVLADGRRLAARVVRQSRDLDLAALQVEPVSAALVAATIGESDALRLGELVVAVGNPLGERNAVTLGMLSAAPHAGRLLRLALVLRPGNSGGALADARGRVVGVPNMVTGWGLALAIPSATVERFLAGESDSTAAEPRDGLIWL